MHGDRRSAATDPAARPRRWGLALLSAIAPPKGKTGKQRWRELVDEKLEELEAVIERARQMTRVLNESRDCDCVSLDACRFLDEASRSDRGHAPVLPPPESRSPSGELRG